MSWNGCFLIGPVTGPKASPIGLQMAVLALGEAEDQYSNPRANMPTLGPVTGQIWKHSFNNIIVKLQ